MYPNRGCLSCGQRSHPHTTHCLAAIRIRLKKSIGDRSTHRHPSVLQPVHHRYPNHESTNSAVETWTNYFIASHLSHRQSVDRLPHPLCPTSLPHDRTLYAHRPLRAPRLYNKTSSVAPPVAQSIPLHHYTKNLLLRRHIRRSRRTHRAITYPNDIT